MKIEFVNKNGGSMFVDEARKEEYIKAGHKPALIIEKAEEKTEKKPIIKKKIKKEV